MTDDSIVKRIYRSLWETAVRGMWKLGFGSVFIVWRTEQILDEMRRNKNK